MSVGTAAGAGVRDEARAALERGVAHLRSLQHDDGYWWGQLESNSSIVSEHVFMLHLFGLANDDLRRRLGNELLATQREDGSWANWWTGPADLSTTVESYYALRLCGIPADDPRMARAREVVHGLGGAERVRFFTKLWLAVMGRYPWDRIPVLPPEMILLPPRAPLSPYRFACWARGTFVALMVVLSRNPTFPQPVGLDELFTDPPGSGPMPGPKTPGRWTPVLTRGMRLAAWYNRHPVGPLRRLSERRVMKWIMERQEADGSWGGIQPPWIYSIIALHSLGLPLDHPVLKKAIDGFDDTFALHLDDGERLRIQACLSPVWDTCLGAVALADAGAAGDDPALRAACDWMLSKEVTRIGD